MDEKIKILGICGSLRKGSYNKTILNYAKTIMPSNVEMEIFDLEGIPLYNADIENPLPERVKLFKEKVKQVDGLLIASPEYSHSYSPVIKNALDWGTRPSGDNSFSDKAVAIMSASTGMFGGTRGQYHLRQVLSDMNMHAVNKPEVNIMVADEKIDENGNITDPEVKEKVKKLIDVFIPWVIRLKKGK